MFGTSYHDYVSVLINLIKCFIKTNNKVEAEKFISMAKLHRKRMLKLIKGENERSHYIPIPISPTGIQTSFFFENRQNDGT